MVLYNKFLIDLINNKKSTNIVAGREFNHEDIKSIKWDDTYSMSYEDYLANQNEESFLGDMNELDKYNIHAGIVIPDVTELTVEKASKLTEKARIYIFNPEEEKMTSNGYFYAKEYVETRKKLDELMMQIDLSEPNELKKAKQIFTLLRKQYEHALPSTGNLLDDIRHSQNAHGCLCLAKGICAGGANSFRAMCSLANIKCRRIHLEVKLNNVTEMSHALNQICVGGEWGIVDVELFKDTPEGDDSLFFCSEDEYEKFWRDKLDATYTVMKNSCPLMPTNISLSREYIDSLGIEKIQNSEDRVTSETTGNEQLRTLAVTEVSAGKITISNLEKASVLANTQVKKEEGER